MTKKERIAALELEVSQLKSQLHMLAMRFDAYLKAVPSGTPQAIPAPFASPTPFKLGSTLRAANNTPQLSWGATYTPTLYNNGEFERVLSKDEVRKLLKLDYLFEGK